MRIPTVCHRKCPRHELFLQPMVVCGRRKPRDCLHRLEASHLPVHPVDALAFPTQAQQDISVTIEYPVCRLPVIRAQQSEHRARGRHHLVALAQQHERDLLQRLRILQERLFHCRRLDQCCEASNDQRVMRRTAQCQIVEFLHRIHVLRRPPKIDDQRGRRLLSVERCHDLDPLSSWIRRVDPVDRVDRVDRHAPKGQRPEAGARRQVRKRRQRVIVDV